MRLQTTTRSIFLLLLSIVGLLATSAVPAGAQPAGREAGRSYIVAFPDTTTTVIDPRYPNTRYANRAYLLLYSALDSRVTITGSGYSRSVDLQSRKFAVVDLMDSAANVAPIVTEANQAVGNTFRVEGDAPFVVYCYLVTRFGSEAWTPLPVESWGNEYFVAARPGEVVHDIYPDGEFSYRMTPKPAPAELAIVAAYDSTIVTIEADAGSFVGVSGVVRVRLDANEVYQMQSIVDTTDSQVWRSQPDIGGTRITSSRPVGVLSGNSRAQGVFSTPGLAQNTYRNMMIEWLAPVAQHGVEFVFLPTWDSKRRVTPPRDPAELEDVEDERPMEHIRIYATSPGRTTGYWFDSTGRRVDFAIAARGDLYEDTVVMPYARYYRTDRPAQLVMNATRVRKYITIGFGTVGASYDAWGGYMVEMTPREQWTGFAPFFCPVEPRGIQHFINVVVDSSHRNDIHTETGARFEFNRGAIPGTSLVWGTMALLATGDHYLEGKNGARFYALVYGLYKGQEEYRPGGTRREDHPDALGISELPDSALAPLHPSEYEEHVAVSYGYPLTLDIRPPLEVDSLEIDSAMGCTDLTLDIRVVNPNPAGLDTVRLEDAVNARVKSLEPQPMFGATTARVVVSPIQFDVDASGTIFVTDRTGHTTRIPYSYIAPRIRVTPPSRISQFDTVAVGASSTRDIVFVNPLSRAIRVDAIRLVDGAQGFRIVRTNPALNVPFEIPAGARFEVIIAAEPTIAGRRFVDSLHIDFDCFDERVALVMNSSGTTAVREPRTPGSSVTIRPHPVSGIASIGFVLARPGDATLAIVDAAGREVARIDRRSLAAGERSIEWDASALPAGVYFYHLRAGSLESTGSIVVVR